jgi:hypothetical protein
MIILLQMSEHTFTIWDTRGKREVRTCTCFDSIDGYMSHDAFPFPDSKSVFSISELKCAAAQMAGSNVPVNGIFRLLEDTVNYGRSLPNSLYTVLRYSILFYRKLIFCIDELEWLAVPKKLLHGCLACDPAVMHICIDGNFRLHRREKCGKDDLSNPIRKYFRDGSKEYVEGQQ